MGEPEPSADEAKTFGNYRINLGDGLSKSMEVEGELHEPGTFVCHVVRSKVGTHRMDLEEDGKSYIANETFDGKTVALIDEDLVIGVLSEMERRIKEREDAAKGKLTLAGVDEAAAEAGAGKAKLAAVPDGSGDDGRGATDGDGYFDGDKDPAAGPSE